MAMNEGVVNGHTLVYELLVLSLSPSAHQLIPLLTAVIKFYWYGLYLIYENVKLLISILITE